MTARVERFEFTEPVPGQGDVLPLMPVSLSVRRALSVIAVVDSGAMISVLPYSVGLDLGAVWENQRFRVPMSGVLGGVEARALTVEVTIGRFRPVALGFAWVRADNVRILLGQTNFFREFDVCFHLSRSRFEVRRAVRPRSGNAEGNGAAPPS